MDWKDIPTTDDQYYEGVTSLRDEIADAVEREGEDASPQVVDSTLDTILSKSALEVFETWSTQKPELEAMLIPYFLEIIVKMNMEPERKKDHRYQYALSTEGRCLEAHKKTKNIFGFIKIEKPVAKPDLYTLDELVKNWREIFVLDTLVDQDENLRNAYAPRCKHKNITLPALILTTQHQLRIVDRNGKYAEGTNISFCRTKSGMGQIVKMTEYLTNLRADGTERESIDDYLAALSREPETYDGTKRWVKVMNLIDYVSKTTHSDLRDVIRLQGYTQNEADELRKVLTRDPTISGIIKRSDLEFEVQSLPEGKKGKFAEIWLPYKGNKICWQVYHEKGDYSYTDFHGDEKSTHIQYKTDRENEIEGGFTPWHWSIMRRLSPYFLTKYELDFAQKVYEPYLSLEHFEKRELLKPMSS